MDSEIQEARLVDADDDIENEVQDAVDPDLEEDEGSLDGGDEEDADVQDGEGPEDPKVEKAKVVREESPKRSPRPPKQKKDLPLPMNMIIAIGIAIIIILAALVYLMRNEDDTDVVVNVPALNIGDEGRYTVKGSILIEDVDEEEPIAGEIIGGDIDLKGSSMTVSVEELTTITDGYYKEYSALRTFSLIDWAVNGWVETVSYDKINIDGSIRVESDSYRNGDTILLTDLYADTDIDAQSEGIGQLYNKDIDSEDYLRTYSSDSGDIQASLDEVIHKPDLEKGMKGQFSNDDVSYDWEVTGTEKVYGEKCVVVEFTVNEPKEEDLETQTIKLYLSNKHPIPVKTSVKLVLVAQGRVTVEYTMTMNRFNRGDQPFTMPEDKITKDSPYFEPRFMEDDLFPDLGSRENSSITYELSDAHDLAEENSGLGDYLDANSEAYLVQGLYNETDGPVWNLTYSYKDENDGYVVIVTESQVEDRGVMKLTDAGPALAVPAVAPVDPICSWAGAEQVLKHDSEVKDACFTGERLNLNDCNIGVRTRLYQPSLDLVSMFASAPRVDYGFTLNKGDELAAGVDAETGQLLFVATHDGPALF